MSLIRRRMAGVTSPVRIIARLVVTDDASIGKAHLQDRKHVRAQTIPRKLSKESDRLMGNFIVVLVKLAVVGNLCIFDEHLEMRRGELRGERGARLH